MIAEKFKTCPVCGGKAGRVDNQGVWIECDHCVGEGGYYTIVNADCGRECFIGGKFIAEDPECPIHGD